MKDFLTDVLKEEEMGFPFGMLNRGLRSVNDVLYGRRAKDEMKTDVQEQEDGYVIDIDLPGFKKEQISLDLENGYLTVKTQKSLDREEKDSAGKLIHQERFTGEMQRSFYVGDAITEEDIRARYTDGVLRLELPKEQTKAVTKKKQIPIGD